MFMIVATYICLLFVSHLNWTWDESKSQKKNGVHILCILSGKQYFAVWDFQHIVMLCFSGSFGRYDEAVVCLSLDGVSNNTLYIHS